jgi:hypothetical protein
MINCTGDWADKAFPPERGNWRQLEIPSIDKAVRSVLPMNGEKRCLLSERPESSDPGPYGSKLTFAAVLKAHTAWPLGVILRPRKKYFELLYPIICYHQHDTI